jgi:hypothetical protein
VRAVYIPDPAQGPAYVLTDELLFVRDGGLWKATGARADGRSLLVDPARPERIYRGGHPPCDEPASSPGIPFEISEDGGLTWRAVPSGQNIRPLAIDPSLPDTLYGSDCALAFSFDGGLTWSRLHLLEGYDITDLAFVGNRLLALGVSSQGRSRLREIDLSDPANPRPGDVLLELGGVACLDADKTRMVVGGRQGVYVSDDGGVSWTSSRQGLEEVTRGDDELPAQLANGKLTDEWGVFSIEIAPHPKHRILAGSAHGLYISQDDGATWVRYSEVGPAEPISAIQFGLDGADLYVTTSRGVVVVPNP